MTEGSTRTAAYAERLQRAARSRWRRWLGVQAPYRWNLKRLALGRTLEIGCGVGRNLRHLDPGSVGVDHNADAVAFARRTGLRAYLPDELGASGDARPGTFDALLFAHVLEHMTRGEAAALVRSHLAYLRRGGRVVVITPQERGFASDPTHVEFLDFGALGDLVRGAGLTPLRAYSFPFPRAVGRLFAHNEFVVVARQDG